MIQRVMVRARRLGRDGLAELIPLIGQRVRRLLVFSRPGDQRRRGQTSEDQSIQQAGTQCLGHRHTLCARNRQTLSLRTVSGGGNSRV